MIIALTPAAGPLGNALTFDGINDCVFVPSDPSLSPGTGNFTAETWFKRDGIPSSFEIIAATQETWQVWYIGLTNSGKINGSIRTIVGASESFAVTSQDCLPFTNLADGNWHHVAFVVDKTNNEIRLYIDGYLSDSSPAVYTGIIAPTNPLGIGCAANQFGNGTPPAAFFNGSIDEVRLWQEVRTQAEINANKNIELTGSEPNLSAYYKMNEGTACADNTGVLTLPDQTANGNDGTLTLMAVDGSLGCNSNWDTGVTTFDTFLFSNDYNNTCDASDTYPVGSTNVVWTATDENGNTDDCTQVITVEDNEAPIISCPANITVNNDPGNCSAVVTFPASTSADNCPGETIAQTLGLASGSAFPVGTTTNTFVVTDASSNTATCTFTVTVTDNVPPTITCPPDVTVNNDPGNCSAVLTYAVTSTDNCPGQTVAQTLGLASGSAFLVGTTTNTFVVTDLAGNTETCSVTVTVTDNEAPSITCPPDITQDNDPGVCEAIIADLGSPVLGDNCPGVTVSNDAPVVAGSFIDAFVSAGSGGLNIPTELVFGPDGNLYVSSFGTDEVLRYNGATGAFINAFVVAGSGGLNQPRGLVFGPDGNLYVNSDVTNEVLRYNGATGAFIDAFVSAGSGGLTRPLGLVFGPDGNLYVSSFSTDEVLRYNGATGAFIDAFVSAGSGGLSSPLGLVFGPDGNLYVSSINTDEVLRYNGATGAFIDAFVSAGSGGLNNPKDLVFGPDGNLYVSSSTDEVLRYNGATGAFIDAFVSAGSGGLDDPNGLVFGPDGNLYVSSINTDEVLRYNGATGVSFPVGSTTVTWTATDAAGNTAICTQNVTVNDNEPPIISCPADITVNNDPGNCSAVVTYAVTSADNCPGETIAQNAWFSKWVCISSRDNY